MLELALMGTALTFLVLGMIDFGRIAYTAMALTNAARAGAFVGSQVDNNSDNFTGMQNAAIASASADIGTIGATATSSCACDVGGVVSAMATCNSACAGVVEKRVSVTTTKTFTTVTRVPFMPNNIALSRTAIMRAK